jgi:hypothetical protein
MIDYSEEIVDPIDPIVSTPAYLECVSLMNEILQYKYPEGSEAMPEDPIADDPKFLEWKNKKLEPGELQKLDDMVIDELEREKIKMPVFKIVKDKMRNPKLYKARNSERLKIMIRLWRKIKANKHSKNGTLFQKNFFGCPRIKKETHRSKTKNKKLGKLLEPGAKIKDNEALIFKIKRFVKKQINLVTTYEEALTKKISFYGSMFNSLNTPINKKAEKNEMIVQVSKNAGFRIKNAPNNDKKNKKIRPPFRCTVCFFSQAAKCNIISHYKAVHEKDFVRPKMICIFCDSIVDNAYIRRHLTKCKKLEYGDMFRCFKCNRQCRSFEDEEEINKIKADIENARTPMHKFMLEQLLKIKRHHCMKIHSQCPTCLRNFYTKNNTHTCKTKRRVVRNKKWKQSLKKSCRKRQVKKREKVRCEYCNCYYASNNTLKIHLNSCIDKKNFDIGYKAKNWAVFNAVNEYQHFNKLEQFKIPQNYVLAPKKETLQRSMQQNAALKVPNPVQNLVEQRSVDAPVDHASNFQEFLDRGFPFEYICKLCSNGWTDMGPPETPEEWKLLRSHFNTILPNRLVKYVPFESNEELLDFSLKVVENLKAIQASFSLNYEKLYPSLVSCRDKALFDAKLIPIDQLNSFYESFKSIFKSLFNGFIFVNDYKSHLIKTREITDEEFKDLVKEYSNIIPISVQKFDLTPEEKRLCFSPMTDEKIAFIIEQTIKFNAYKHSSPYLFRSVPIPAFNFKFEERTRKNIYHPIEEGWGGDFSADSIVQKLLARRAKQNNYKPENMEKILEQPESLLSPPRSRAPINPGTEFDHDEFHNQVAAKLNREIKKIELLKQQELEEQKIMEEMYKKHARNKLKRQQMRKNSIDQTLIQLTNYEPCFASTRKKDVEYELLKQDYFKCFMQEEMDYQFIETMENEVQSLLPEKDPNENNKLSIIYNQSIEDRILNFGSPSKDMMLDFISPIKQSTSFNNISVSTSICRQLNFQSPESRVSLNSTHDTLFKNLKNPEGIDLNDPQMLEYIRLIQAQKKMGVDHETIKANIQRNESDALLGKKRSLDQINI